MYIYWLYIYIYIYIYYVDKWLPPQSGRSMFCFERFAERSRNSGV